MAQLVTLMSGVVLGGVAEVVGSNLARGKIFTASIGSVDSLYPSVYIYIYIYSIYIYIKRLSFIEFRKQCFRSQKYTFWQLIMLKMYLGFNIFILFHTISIA